MDKNNEDSEERILEITQEDYDEMKASGIDEEAIPSVGKHIFRRRTRKINPRDAKIKTTVFIDGDVLQYFRRRAEATDAAEFGTQINQELRAAMERDLAAQEENKLDEVAKKLLDNPNFLQAISEKLKAA